MPFFNNSEIIRKFTLNDYKKVLEEKPEKIGEFKYVIKDNKIYLLDKKEEYELVPVEKRQNLILNTYKDPRFIGGYKKIYKILSTFYAGITREDVHRTLSTLESFQQRQRIKKRKIVKPVITSEPLEIWQMDLIILKKYKEYNDDYKYLLVIIDLFTKYTMIAALKSKKAEYIAEALKKFLDDM